jgi:hypothetical protein
MAADDGDGHQRDERTAVGVGRPAAVELAEILPEYPDRKRQEQFITWAATELLPALSA